MKKDEKKRYVSLKQKLTKERNRKENETTF